MAVWRLRALAVEKKRPLANSLLLGAKFRSRNLGRTFSWEGRELAVFTKERGHASLWVWGYRKESAGERFWPEGPDRAKLAR